MRGGGRTGYADMMVNVAARYVVLWGPGGLLRRPAISADVRMKEDTVSRSAFARLCTLASQSSGPCARARPVSIVAIGPTIIASRAVCIACLLGPRMNASMPNSSVAEVGTAAPAHHKSTTVSSRPAMTGATVVYDSVSGG